MVTVTKAVMVVASKVATEDAQAEVVVAEAAEAVVVAAVVTEVSFINSKFSFFDYSRRPK